MRKAGTTVNAAKRLREIETRARKPKSLITGNVDNISAPKPPIVANADVVVAFPVYSIALLTDSAGDTLCLSSRYLSVIMIE